MTKGQRTRVNNTGVVEGLCSNCTRPWRPLDQAFTPCTTSENTMRRASELRAAINEHNNFFAQGDQNGMQIKMAIIISMRTTMCRVCTTDRPPSPAVLRCMAEWERMRKDACNVHGGCSTPGCPERGMASWPCMSADHIVPEDKTHRLSDYPWWSYNGGVDAMKQEAAKVKWICNCCHRLESTSSSGQTKKRQTLQGRIDKNARVVQKQTYVDNCKLLVGQCQYPDCGRKVTTENARAFDWDHRDPTTKATHITHPLIITKSTAGGVSGIVKNDSKRAALEHCKVELDAEMAKCDLLCRNCHCSRKPTGRARWDVS